MKLNKWAIMLTGLLSVNVLSAEAQVEMNMGGSSAGTGFATQVPLELFLPYNAITNPIRHYVNGNIAGPPAITSGKLHVWTGQLDGAKVPGQGGLDGIIRYAATGSSDGVQKLQNAAGIVPVSSASANMTHLDHVTFTGCSGPALIDSNGDSLTDFEEFTGCTATFAKPSHLGASDVHGSSFHQTGPVTTTVKPLAQDLLTSTQAAIVPFKVILGKGIKKTGPAGLVNVDSLTRSQVEALLSQTMTNWRLFGFIPDVDGDGIDDGTNPMPVALCLRQAGSGTKAALDETVMINANEAVSGTLDLTSPTATVLFGKSTQDVRDCIAGNAGLSRPAHPLAIGYLDADFVFPGPIPGGYDVKLDGFHANDTTLADPKSNLKNGLYYFWVGWRLNYRTADDPGISPAQDALISAFVTQSQRPVIINNLPGAGPFWVAPCEMNVQKNNDRGPIAWKTAPTPCP